MGDRSRRFLARCVEHDCSGADALPRTAGRSARRLRPQVVLALLATLALALVLADGRSAPHGSASPTGEVDLRLEFLANAIRMYEIEEGRPPLDLRSLLVGQDPAIEGEWLLCDLSGQPFEYSVAPNGEWRVESRDGRVRSSR